MQRTKEIYDKRGMKLEGSPEFIDISDWDNDEIILSHPKKFRKSWEICHSGHNKVHQCT